MDGEPIIFPSQFLKEGFMEEYDLYSQPKINKKLEEKLRKENEERFRKREKRGKVCQMVLQMDENYSKQMEMEVESLLQLYVVDKEKAKIRIELKSGDAPMFLSILKFARSYQKSNVSEIIKMMEEVKARRIGEMPKDKGGMI